MTKRYLTKTLLLALSLCLGSHLMHAAKVTLNFANKGDIETNGLSGGIYATNEGLFPDIAANSVASFTFTFDLSTYGIGVDTLDVTVTGTSGGSSALINDASNNGLAATGTSGDDLRFDTGETLSFAFTAKDAGDNVINDDLTKFDFTGFSSRARASAGTGTHQLDFNVTGAGTIAGAAQTIAPTTSNNYYPVSSFTAYSLLDGGAPQGITAVRSDTGTDLFRLSQLQFDIVAVPEPSSYALLGGCFALAWVMVRRRRS